MTCHVELLSSCCPSNDSYIKKLMILQNIDVQYRMLSSV